MSGPFMAAFSKQLFGIVKSLQNQAAADVNLTIEQRVANMVKDEISATVSGSAKLGVEAMANTVEQLKRSDKFRLNNDWMGGSYVYKDLAAETLKRKYFYHRIRNGEMPLKFQNYYGSPITRGRGRGRRRPADNPNNSLVALLNELKNQANIAETLFMAFGGIQYKKQGYELGKFNPDQRLYDAQAKRRRSVRA